MAPACHHPGHQGCSAARHRPFLSNNGAHQSVEYEVVGDLAYWCLVPGKPLAGLLDRHDAIPCPHFLDLAPGQRLIPGGDTLLAYRQRSERDCLAGPETLGDPGELDSGYPHFEQPACLLNRDRSGDSSRRYELLLPALKV